jgi:hypothetical protein
MLLSNLGRGNPAPTFCYVFYVTSVKLGAATANCHRTWNKNPTPNPLPLRVNASGTLRVKLHEVAHQSPTVGNPPTALVHRKR